MNKSNKIELKSKYLTDILNEIKKSESSKLFQFTENDLKSLESGIHFQKMNIEKKKFQKRVYKLDFRNRRIVATTRQLGKKNKICLFFKV